MRQLYETNNKGLRMNLTDTMQEMLTAYVGSGKGDIKSWLRRMKLDHSEESIKEVEKLIEPLLSKYVELHGEIKPVEKKKGDFPSLAKQAAGVVDFAKDVVKDVAKGKKIRVDIEEYRRRVAICMGCELFIDDRCSLCGCFMKRKAVYANRQCADKPSRWDAE